ncbi:hypothetical protein RB195_019222 [Necator americanus]|uniref:Histone-lysine N-methyltransferase SETMAR n=1 Tax=Necator americanus TaxID=51031 RepID=A0ABR1CG20_NECAM
MPDPFVKGEIHEKKVMVSVWWGVHGIYRFELLPDNTTVTRSTALNCKDWPTRSARSTRSSTTFACCTITRPHIAKKTSQKSLELGWEVLPHQPYSSDLVPSDYHLFQSLQHCLEEKQYDDRDHLENELRAFFASNSPEFYAKGIRNHVRRWQKVVDVDGDYFVE